MAKSETKSNGKEAQEKAAQEQKAATTGETMSQAERDAMMRQLVERQTRLEQENQNLAQALREAQEQKVQSRVKHFDGSGGKQDREAIQEWLDSDSSPYVYFSDPFGVLVQAFPDKVLYNNTTGEKTRRPAGLIRFEQWHRVGSELRDPSNPKKPRFLWGYVDLRENEQVKREWYTLEDLQSALHDSELYRRGDVFPEEIAKRKLRAVYETIWQKEDLRAEEQARLAAIPRGAEKIGA